jgi:tetratricopeptide (TPR) repeat protein
VTAVPDLAQALDAFNRGDLGRARELAASALEGSQSPQLQHLLGLIECRLGNLDRGIEWLRRASEGEPENIGFKVMLARALVDAKRAEEALDVANPPAGTSPPELALWHVRAEAADLAGKRSAAVEAWGKLCQAGTGDWRAWSNYGGALAAEERWEEAANALKRATSLNPSELSLRRTLASALAQAGQHDKSADILKQWIGEARSTPADRLLLARLLADLGRDEESLAQLDSAARLATGKPFVEKGDGLIAIATVSGNLELEVLRELARLLERTSRLDALRVLLGEAETRGVNRKQLGFAAAAVALKDGDAAGARELLLAENPQTDPVRWHWLMARIADAMGDSGTAFAEAEAMNRSAGDHDRWRGRAAAHLEWLDTLAEMVTPEWASRIASIEPSSRRSPAFLVGFPRSGTTLLDTFLMGHPQAKVLEEVPLVHAIESVLGKMAVLPDRSAQEMAKAREAYFAELDQHVDPGFEGLVVDKLPLNILAAPFLQAIFPDARFIFAQRHPCDCVLSGFMQGFALNPSMACFLDIGDSAAFYDKSMSVWTRCRESLPLKVHTIIYEDLVVSPEASLRPLVDFLGLDWREELLDHRSTAKARGAISTPSYDQVVQPLNQRASGRWRRYEKQLAPVLPVLLPWAERLGYSE